MDTHVMTATKVRRILNRVASRKTETDWRIASAGRIGIIEMETDLPSEVDLREAWWDVGNQGGTGSCVGWAVADSVVRWHFVKKNMLGQDEHLSVRQVWMAAKETDVFTGAATTFIEEAGTTIKDALDYVRVYGVVTEDILGFNAPLYQGDEAGFYILSVRRRIANYFNLHMDLPGIKRWLSQQGPVIVGLDIDSTFDSVSDSRSSTVVKLQTYDGNNIRGGHAAALVGYNDDENCFILRNSWGETWGDKGYIKLDYQYANGAIKEAYGVIV